MFLTYKSVNQPQHCRPVAHWSAGFSLLVQKIFIFLLSLYFFYFFFLLTSHGSNFQKDS